MGTMFNIGDRVSPKPEYVGSKDIFKIIGIHECNNGKIKYNLEQLTYNDGELSKDQLINWFEDELILLPSIKQPVPVNLQVDYKPYKSLYIEGIDLCEKENKKMKILEIYSREAFSKIDEKYDELEKEVRENDNINKIIQDASNQINVLLDRDEKNAISLVPSGTYSELLELKSSEKIVELKHDRDREKIKVEKLIEEIRARLEICDDDEFSKVSVLQAYKILDEEGKLAEYKIEKKGKK